MCIREFHAVLRNVNQKTDTRGMFQTDFQNYLQNKDRSKAGDDMQGSLKEQNLYVAAEIWSKVVLA